MILWIVMFRITHIVVRNLQPVLYRCTWNLNPRLEFFTKSLSNYDCNYGLTWTNFGFLKVKIWFNTRKNRSSTLNFILWFSTLMREPKIASYFKNNKFGHPSRKFRFKHMFSRSDGSSAAALFGHDMDEIRSSIHRLGGSGVIMISHLTFRLDEHYFLITL